MGVEFDGERHDFLPLMLTAADREVLVDGVGLFARPVGDSDTGQFTMRHLPVVEVVFGPGTPFEGENVTDRLSALVSGARSEVAPLLELIS